MINKIKIIDNFLPKSWHEHLLHQSLSNWGWKMHECTGHKDEWDDNTWDEGQWVAEFVSIDAQDNVNHGMNINYLSDITPLQFFVDEHLENFKIHRPIRVKANTLTKRPDAPVGTYNSPHFDGYDGKVSFLYYLNDSDGDTVFFEENVRDMPPNNIIPDKYNVRLRSTPKANTAVIFDSSIFHASSQPRETFDRRVLNIVYEVNYVKGE